jgi:hypothetical protein
VEARDPHVLCTYCKSAWIKGLNSEREPFHAPDPERYEASLRRERSEQAALSMVR